MNVELPNPRGRRRRRIVAEGPVLVPTVSRTLAWRCLYAGAFFYASFALHTWAKSEKFGPPIPEAWRLAPEAKAPLEPGIFEGTLAALVLRDGGPR